MQKKYSKYVEWGVMILLFVGLLKLSTGMGFEEGLKPETIEDRVLTILGIIVMVHVVLAVHELGHLIVGLIQGFRFELFVVGLLGIKREDQKIKIYFNKNLGHYGGVAATSPVDDSADNPNKLARILLAGPIASILFAIICLGLATFLGKPFGMIFYAGGVTSIGIFLATTVPSRTGMFFTDRKRYQRLVNPGKDRDVELAILNISGKFSKDNSYRNIAKKEIETLIADDIPFIHYFGWFNMICWEIDHLGTINKETKAGYDTAAKTVSATLTSLFDKEIEKYFEKTSTSPQ